MGHDLKPNNTKLEIFDFGWVSLTLLLRESGYLFPAIGDGTEYYSHDKQISFGFLVTDEDAKILARIARNFVSEQRSLPESQRGDPFKENYWPIKIEDHWTDSIEKFADWAEKSGGFRVN